MNEKKAIEQPGHILDMVRVNGRYIVEHRSYRDRRQASSGDHRHYDSRQCRDRRHHGHIDTHV
jgi:hypothetical protein